jgi:glycosyltransferase involved in cell wall biosynthesis
VSDPLVSILIPTYNGERFLRAALRSAVEQSYKNLEILVGDDASTDRTPEIIATVAASDPRVRVIRHETNVGAFGNPIRLFEQARGEYVKYLLHDDVLATDCVKDLVRGIESTPGARLAFSRRVLIDENGKPLQGHEFPVLADRPGPLDGRELGDFALQSTSNAIGELTTILFRREDVDSAWMWQVDGRRLEVLGDLSLALRLLRDGPAFYTPRLLSRFRSHPGQSSFDPRLIARGLRDWPRLIDWAARNGFLADQERRRVALTRAMTMAVQRVAQLVDGQECGTALEGAFLSMAGLAELICRVPAGPDRPLTERAHAGPLFDRFSQELDAWPRQLPVALAAPAIDAAEIRATVDAFREVLAADAAEKCLLAVPEPLVADAVPLVESALAEGTDIDIEIVPSNEPATLLRGDWLAVAPRGATWHKGLATAVYAVDAVAFPALVPAC